MSRRAWEVIATWVVLVACAVPIHSELSAVDTHHVPRRIAVLPVRSDPERFDSPSRDAAERVTEALRQAIAAQTGLTLLESDDASVEAHLSGSLVRYVERTGGAHSSGRPASVEFTLELWSKDKVRVWTGHYKETQRGLSDDLASLGRAWQRGFRWVTADELAEYGARELVDALVEELDAWS